MNHPLFLMAVHNRYKLMAHPLSQSLLDQKFFPWSLILFILGSLFYLTFLIIFTIIVTRTKHPEYYYELTGFQFDSNLCRNVTAALGGTGLKNGTDRALRILMFILSGIVLVKSSWAIIGYLVISWWKAMGFLLEFAILIFNFYFIFDYDFQSDVTMRCPIQWQIGACGLFLGYFALFYYIQYIPIIGTYVIMLRVIFMRFLLFLPVFMVFIVAFGLTFYMLFQNFGEFQNIAIGFGKTGIIC